MTTVTNCVILSSLKKLLENQLYRGGLIGESYERREISMYIPREQLESIAEKYTAAYFNMIAHESETRYPRVDPARIAGDLLHLNLYSFPLSVEGTILGCCALDETEIELYFSDGHIEPIHLRKGDIVIDSSLEDASQEGRRNFTIAHETAHQILNREFPGSHIPLRHRRVHVLYRRRGQHDSIEWQADTLASMLLMPRPLIYETMKQFDLNKPIEILNRAFYWDEFQKFENMAQYLGVSKQALCIRLKQLKLVGKEYLANPYDLVNVYVDDENM